MKTLGWIWALPTTLIGFLLAILGRTVFYRMRPGGVFQFVAIDGPWMWFFRRYSMGAITIGAVSIFTVATKDDLVMIRHERQHTYQARWLGPLFIPAYYLLCLWALLRGGSAYRDNPLEVQAYRVEKDLDG